MGKIVAFTLVVTCRGRLAQLKQSLPRFLRLPDTRVIVVDFTCPDGAGDYVTARLPAAGVVRVPGQPFFNLAAARNAGAREARTPWLIFCDADTLVGDGFIGLIRQELKPAQFLTFTSASGNSLGGSCVVSTRAYRAVQGFDEVFTGYGGEDLDFYWRLARQGLRQMAFRPSPDITAIEHDAALRTAHYAVKDVKRSFLHARAYRLVKEVLLGLTFAGELPLPARQQLWDDVGRALARDAFSITVRLPGNATSGFLSDWTWKRELVVSFEAAVKTP